MQGYKTYLGLAIALAPTVAHLFGYRVTPELSSQLPDIADTLVQLFGLAFATYGRLVATVPGWFAKE